MSSMRQKKIAVINDLSGYGRCSLTVAIPIISALKVQCCPVPTSILSNHTGFSTYFFDDYTPKMEPYLEQWRKLKLEFDGILTGFLGSEEQIAIVSDMIAEFRGPRTRVIIDPIMGDHGKAYQTYTEKMCREMKRLVQCGDIITPNVTEACLLTGRPYKEAGWKQSELETMAGELHAMGPAGVVITGVTQGQSVTNVVSAAGGPVRYQSSQRVGRERPGTGDVFSAVTAAEVVRGTALPDAARKAAGFVKRCIQKSEELEVPVENGVCFEELMELRF